jgi:hypothetical protein
LKIHLIERFFGGNKAISMIQIKIPSSNPYFILCRGLNLKKLVINPEHGPAIYDLAAVTNHYGGLGGGHCK